MPDMLVKLYELDRYLAAYPPVNGVEVRAAMAYEKSQVLAWITREFNARWADEAAAGFARQPVSCLIAVRDGKVVGFACYEATLRGFAGPIGVAADARSAGLGARLTLAALQGLKHLGYAYAIIGGVGPEEFYTRICGATVIPGSSPGIYAGMLEE
jgi:predicted N-acetyltransferase YhbS